MVCRHAPISLFFWKVEPFSSSGGHFVGAEMPKIGGAVDWLLLYYQTVNTTLGPPDTAGPLAIRTPTIEGCQPQPVTPSLCHHRQTCPILKQKLNFFTDKLIYSEGSVLLYTSSH